MSRKIRRNDCHGCYNEFYHCGGVNGDTKKCWSFDNAEMSKGRVQSIDALPKDYRGAWILIPDCYRRQRYFVERKD